jgi:photosystem II stability/assembly factor-like uncharacterized protein
MIAIVGTRGGSFAIDLDSDEVEPWPAQPDRAPELVLNLPRVVAAASAGAAVYAVVDARPPLLVSHDAGSSWRAVGHGLPPGRAVAVSPLNTDDAVFAARNRLYLTRDGGRFWTALTVELPEIESVELREA